MHYGTPLFPYTTLFRSTSPVGSSSAAVLATRPGPRFSRKLPTCTYAPRSRANLASVVIVGPFIVSRSEEHTSELQSRGQLVCRLLLAKQKTHCATTKAG